MPTDDRHDDDRQDDHPGPMKPYVWGRRILDGYAQAGNRPKPLKGLIDTACRIWALADPSGLYARSNADLAVYCGASSETVGRHVRILAGAGLLVLVREADPRTSMPAAYRLTWPPEWYSGALLWDDLAQQAGSKSAQSKQAAYRARQWAERAREELLRLADDTPDTTDDPPRPRTGGGRASVPSTPPVAGRGGYPSPDGGAPPSGDGAPPYRGFRENPGMADVGETGTGTRAHTHGAPDLTHEDVAALRALVEQRRAQALMQGGQGLWE